MAHRRIGRKYSQRTLLLGLGGCLLFLLCLLFVSSVVLAGLYLYLRNDGTVITANTIIENPELPTPSPPALPTTSALAPLPPPDTGTPPTNSFEPTATLPPPATPPPVSKIAVNPPLTLNQEPIPERAFLDLINLYETDYPAHDYYSALLTLGDSETTASLNVGPRTNEQLGFNVGDRQIFLTDQGNVEATLFEITEHAYFWVDDALTIDQSALHNAGEYLESTQIYGQFVHLFGQPWNPGMDNDPRFSILHLAGSEDEYELGYFSDLDEYPNTLPLFDESNQQEIIYLNMDQLEIGTDLYYGTLVHELQHLAQWNLDKNESVWLNEGISQLAELYVGLDTAVPDAYFEKPDTRLDQWAYDDDVIDAHYANTFVFVVYLWEQLNEAGIYELVREPANGLSAVRKILQGHKPDVHLNQFLADWTAANYLDDPAAGSQYGYTRLNLPKPSYQTRVRQLPVDTLLEIDQLAAHYIDLDYSGKMNLSFAGDTTAKLIDAPPPSGDQMWFSQPENDAHAQLISRFDLRNLQQATLEFNTWYDLEEDFDFAYLTVSTDQGASWTILPSQHSSPGDYGPGFTGQSSGSPAAIDGWIQERISLHDYLGQEILISFQLLTDFEGVGRGFALDNIAIPELGYSTDVESSESQWQADGFLRTGWLLPQEWSVQLIHRGNNPRVTALPLDDFNRYQGEVELGTEGAVLAIMPLTPFVQEKTHYWLQATN